MYAAADNVHASAFKTAGQAVAKSIKHAKYVYDFSYGNFHARRDAVLATSKILLDNSRARDKGSIRVKYPYVLSR